MYLLYREAGGLGDGGRKEVECSFFPQQERELTFGKP